jgi:hypothetical protein
VAEPEGTRMTVERGWAADLPWQDGRQVVGRSVVAAGLRMWMQRTRASQLGRTFNVTHPAASEEMTGWLIEGSGDAGGPVAAVLALLGIDVVDDYTE